MRTLEEINQEIQMLEEDLKTTVGTETEVYTRIVGYHRALTNWNKGKRREYDERKTFRINNKHPKFNKSLDSSPAEPAKTKKVQKSRSSDNLDLDSIAYYNIFYSQFCHNCPPVKDFMSTLPLEGENIDVSSDLGLNVAKEYDVMSTPAVILFDKNNKVLQKAHSIEELKTIFPGEKKVLMAN